MSQTANAETGALLPPSEALALLNRRNEKQSEQTSVKPSEKITTFFGVHLGSFGLLFDDNLDKELVEINEVCSLANSPSWLDGFCNIRGSITPVINLYQLFGIDQKQESTLTKKYLLALNKGSSTFGLPLMKLPEKMSFKERDVHDDEELAPTLLKPYILACYRNTHPWFFIDHQGFLTHIKNCP